MVKFMRKYNKKLLAVFAVGLMIVFVLPNQVKNQRGFNEQPTGTIGEDKVYAPQVSSAKREWGMLNRMIGVEGRSADGRRQPWQ